MVAICRLGAVFLVALATSAIAGINVWTTTGPRGGWTFLATDPSAPGRVFAAREGLLYRSIDSGLTWARTEAPGVTAMAVDPLSPDTIYATFLDNAVRKSTDGGQTWGVLPGRLGRFPSTLLGANVVVPGSYFTRVWLSPSTVARIWAFDGDVWLSEDAGVSFTKRTPGGATQTDVARAMDGTPPALYAVNASTVPGTIRIQKSVDDGLSWNAIDSGIDAQFKPRIVAVDPGDSDHVIVAGTVGDDRTALRVYATIDGGISWALIHASTQPTLSDPANPPRTFTMDVAYPLPCCAELLWRLDFDPQQKDRFVLKLPHTLLLSNDSGVTWSELELQGSDTPVAFAYGDDPNEWFAVGTGYGFQRSTNGGLDWEPRNAGLPGDAVSLLATSVTADVASQFTGGSLRYYARDSGGMWQAPQFRTPTPQIVDITVPGDGGMAYAVSDQNVVSSDDRFETWSASGGQTPCFWLAKIAVAASAPEKQICFGYSYTVVAGNSFLKSFLYKTEDAGATWGIIRPLYSFTFSLAFDPLLPQTIWSLDDIGLTTSAPEFGIVLRRSDDGGNTWSETWCSCNPITLTENSAPQTAIQIDPEKPSHIVVGGNFEEHIVESLDRGDSWSEQGDNLSVDLEIHAVAVDWRANPRVIYVGTQRGVFMRVGDAPWVALPGSERFAVNAMRLMQPQSAPDRATVVIATDSGVWEYTADAEGNFAPVYRLFEALTRVHLFTISDEERATALANDPNMVDEGIAFLALRQAAAGAIPVYRLIDTNTGVPGYTSDPAERDVWLQSPQVVDGGIAWYAFTSAEPSTVGVHRFFDTTTGTLFYTADDEEALIVGQRLPSYIDQGIVFAAYPPAPLHRTD